MNIFGHNFRLAIWGESHGPQIGISIDGVPAGIPLSAEDFEADLARRRSGARGTPPRREPGIPQIVSGLYNGMTTGAPLTIEFANTDTHSQDYATVARHYRPSHADLVAYHRFNGFNDPRGGGHFSARLTVAFVAAGVVAKKMLPPGIAFDTRLTEIGGCTDPARLDEGLRAAASRAAYCNNASGEAIHAENSAGNASARLSRAKAASSAISELTMPAAHAGNSSGVKHAGHAICSAARRSSRTSCR